MTDWQSGCLTAIAVAMVITSLVQIAVLVMVAMAGRQMIATLQQVQRDLGPLIEKAHRITDDARRATELALKQVERIDQLVTAASATIEDTVAVVQGAIIGPLTQGTAVVSGVKTALSVVRSLWSMWESTRGRRAAHREDEDELFIG